MNKSDIKEGRVYQLRHGGNLTAVRVDTIQEITGGRIGNSRRYRAITRFYCTKLSTNRTILVKSAVRFMREVYPETPTKEAETP